MYKIKLSCGDEIWKLLRSASDEPVSAAGVLVMIPANKTLSGFFFVSPFDPARGTVFCIVVTQAIKQDGSSMSKRGKYQTQPPVG